MKGELLLFYHINTSKLCKAYIHIYHILLPMSLNILMSTYSIVSTFNKYRLLGEVFLIARFRGQKNICFFFSLKRDIWRDHSSIGPRFFLTYDFFNNQIWIIHTMERPNHKFSANLPAFWFHPRNDNLHIALSINLAVKSKGSCTDKVSKYLLKSIFLCMQQIRGWEKYLCFTIFRQIFLLSYKILSNFFVNAIILGGGQRYNMVVVLDQRNDRIIIWWSMTYMR